MDSLPGRGKEVGENGNNSESCCAPNAAETTLCGLAPAPNATETTLCCPAPAYKKDSSTGLDITAMAADLADIDLNKWIGTLKNRVLVCAELC